MNGRVLFLVPARGGSKTVPGKNLRTVAGISLVARAVRRARRAAAIIGLVDAPVICSTDDKAIAAEARAWGAEIPFARPRRISGDEASTVDVALHALDWFGKRGERFDVLALVQPTSPLSAPHDVARAVEAVLRSNAPASATVSRAAPAEWLYSVVEGRLRPRTDPSAGRRQDLPPTYELNGAAYVIRTEALRRSRTFVIAGSTTAVVIPPDRSVDVDTEEDLAFAEAVADAIPAHPVQLGDRSVGDGRCLIIAEIGVNHNGSLDMARQLVDAAAQVGADVVKFQTFDPDAIAAADAPLAEYQVRAGNYGGQRSMLAQLALSREAHRELQARASAAGLLFLSSPFDEASAQFLFDLGVPAFKVGSGELTNHPLLRRMAGFRLPMLLSTGMSNIREVAAAVDSINDAAGEPELPLVLLHCVSRYPAPAEDSNLRAIRTIRSAFGVPAGWSDHTTDSETAATAVALGAAVVEKHLTLSRHLPGPDHRASIEPDSFRTMVNRIRAVENSLGSGEKISVAGEAEIAAVARKSLHWATSLPAGTIVDSGHLVALRPGTGISPAETGLLLGRTLTRGVERGELIELRDVEPEPR